MRPGHCLCRPTRMHCINNVCAVSTMYVPSHPRHHYILHTYALLSNPPPPLPIPPFPHYPLPPAIFPYLIPFAASIIQLFTAVHSIPSANWDLICHHFTSPPANRAGLLHIRSRRVAPAGRPWQRLRRGARRSGGRPAFAAGGEPRRHPADVLLCRHTRFTHT
jgi:hypothetical protein